MALVSRHCSDEVGDDTVHTVAGIWARAAARRDGREEPVDVETAVPGVRRRLALDGATLLTARHDDAVVGFALCAPNPRALELFYLAVDPAQWGGGVAAELLAAVDDHADEQGCDLLQLWVIDDNTRAIEVYERAGWVATDDIVTDATSRRNERRFVRRRP